MKNQFTTHVLSYVMVLLLMAGCNMDTKTKDKKNNADTTKVASVEVEVFDAVKIKDQIVETIRQMPSEKEIATLLNESGASYIVDLTVPTDQADKLMTESDQSFGLGLYSFDLIYASIYNRGDKAAEISRISEQLIDRLGLRNDLTSSKNQVDRIKKNTGNKDSLDFLVTQNLNHFHQQMSKGDQPDVYALSVIGSNVEALYLLSQSTLMAKNKVKMLDIMSRQNERVKGVFTLLELMSADENIKPYYEQFKPVVTIFEQNKKITEKELAQIAPIMETFRQNILKK